MDIDYGWRWVGAKQPTHSRVVRCQRLMDKSHLKVKAGAHKAPVPPTALQTPPMAFTVDINHCVVHKGHKAASHEQKSSARFLTGQRVLQKHQDTKNLLV